ncbi:hypothetical protein GCM10010471_02500 [Leucobacter komagatae]
MQACELFVREDVELDEFRCDAVGGEGRPHLFDHGPGIITEVTAGLSDEGHAHRFHGSSLGRAFATLVPMRRIIQATGVTLTLLLVAGCAGAGPATSTTPKTGGTDAPTGSTSQLPTDTPFSLDGITSCAQVEAVVTPYITGLVPNEANTVDEWGVSCSWETAEGELNPDNIRAVSVQLAPVEAGSETPDTSLIADMDGGEVLEHGWVTSNGGVAFSLSLGTAVAGAIATTVWVPGVEATVGGGQWAGAPALDGEAAVEVVRSLIG